MNKILFFIISICFTYAFNNQDPKANLSAPFKKPNSQLNETNYSHLSRQNIMSASLIEFNDHSSFSIGIHCNNIDLIAGFQFELPDNLKILNLNGRRAQDSDFQLHHNKQGLILGFSMSGETISALSDEHTSPDNSMIIQLEVKAEKGNSLVFPIKTILAGPKGEKLSFKSLDQKLSFEDTTITISFYE